MSQAAEMHEIHLPQGPIRYRESGSGEPIVLVHGVLVNGELWRDVIPILAKDFRVIAPDWPLGSQELPLDPSADLSPPGLARLVVDFLEALDLERVTLVGNDTGGAICQLVATEHPQRIGRMVLTPCDAYEHFPPPAFKALATVGRSSVALLGIAQAMRSATIRRLPIGYGGITKRADDALTASWATPLRRNAEIRHQTAKIFAGMRPEHTLRAARGFPELKIPVLLAWAPEDRFFKLANAERMAHEIPGARLELIEDSLTFVAIDQPQRTAALIAEFARERVAAVN
ncbi:MAG TPA: alpha/beta hydrolase [Solirubrobacteraceae bacterium]|jgi:pimeloyl-ACP methyl ester carboxylesterase|nr:alpha/beta hydrolase [Solirubrobacteraceae bacterium]